MEPRVLFRTHYQVDEPALMEFLVKRCTSPIRSAYNESVAQKLAEEVQHRGKKFNVAAGGYALDLARGLSLVNEQNVWTDRGHLVNLHAETEDRNWDAELELNSRERLLHFRLFLEGDGAALLSIARYLLDHGKMPNSDGDWNQLAKMLFVEIYSEYHTMAGTTADRVALRREVDRIRSRGYEGKSGPHKMFVHLQTLHRLDLVDRVATSTSRNYRLESDSGRRNLRSLVSEIPDLYALERAVQEHRLFEIAAKVFGIEHGPVAQDRSPEELIQLVVPYYRQVVATGVSQCPLSTVIESVQIGLLDEGRELIHYDAALDLIQKAQQKRVGEIRFHVDRRGTPAFLKLSDELLASSS